MHVGYVQLVAPDVDGDVDALLPLCGSHAHVSGRQVTLGNPGDVLEGDEPPTPGVRILLMPVADDPGITRRAEGHGGAEVVVGSGEDKWPLDPEVKILHSTIHG